MLKGLGFVFATLSLLYLAGVTPSRLRHALDRAGESAKAHALDHSDPDWGKGFVKAVRAPPALPISLRSQCGSREEGSG